MLIQILKIKKNIGETVLITISKITNTCDVVLIKILILKLCM